MSTNATPQAGRRVATLKRPTSTLCVRMGDLQPVITAWCEQSGQELHGVLKGLVHELSGRPEHFEHVKQSQSEARLRISIGPEAEGFLQWCRSQGLAQSAAIRLMLVSRLREWIMRSPQDRSAANRLNVKATDEETGFTVKVGVADRIDETDRIRLRLSRSEMQALKTLAATHGVNATKLATQVLRAYMLQGAVLSPKEQVDLGAINLSLMRIGGNLNQIARHINTAAQASTVSVGGQEGAEASALEVEIRACIEAVQSQVKEASKALDLSRQRWRIEVQS